MGKTGVTGHLGRAGRATAEPLVESANKNKKDCLCVGVREQHLCIPRSSSSLKFDRIDEVEPSTKAFKRFALIQ
jgi:hypothetical protein